MIIETWIAIALSHTATIYGIGEIMCGDTHNPQPCLAGQSTASGEMFDPNLPTAAVPMPFNRRMRPTYIWLQGTNGCVKIRVNDKKHERYINNGGLDLTPKTLELLGIKPTKHWSGKIELCNEPFKKDTNGV